MGGSKFIPIQAHPLWSVQSWGSKLITSIMSVMSIRPVSASWGGNFYVSTRKT